MTVNVNCSYGAASPGSIANAAIGRAMRFITKNIRGIRRQIEDMGVLGNPGKYSFVVGGERRKQPLGAFPRRLRFQERGQHFNSLLPAVLPADDTFRHG